VKRVSGPASVDLRVGESGDDVEELDDGARPAVGDEQGKGVRVSGSGVDEVDRLSLDPGAEVRKLVQPRLLRAPVEGVAPVLDQLA
jgi:hypothetical protein